ncbi:MAG: glycosyltransferase family 4 protein [Methylovirgula sp.]
MRIAYLINQYPKVSHSFIRREILALERQGIEVIRIALRGWSGVIVDDEDRRERERTRYVLRENAMLLVAAGRVLFAQPRRFVHTLALVWKMSRHSERPLPVHLIYLIEACQIVLWLQDTEIQHVHVHFGTNPAEVAMLVHALGGPRWSFTAHGPEEFDKREALGLAEKLRRCAFVVAISSYGRSQIYRCIGYESWSKVQVIHCGLDTDFFAAPAIHLPAARHLVCVGRLCEQKGQLLLIEAMRLLASQGVDFELVLAGDGEMRHQIETLIARDSLRTRVRITGWISGAQVRAEICASRGLVLPSFAEGLPVVIMEAMALRRPVISTFVAGIPELVQQGEHGWLVPAGDVDALANAIRECLDMSDVVLTRMGEAAHKRVLARHSVDTEASRLIKLFRAAAIEDPVFL